MTPVSNIGRACVLACFESFFRDNEYKITQLMLINFLMTKCLCTYDGVVYEIEKVSKALGLNYIQLNSILPVFSNLKKTQSVFVFFNDNDMHSIRFFENVLHEDKIVAMNPDCFSSTKLEYFDKSLLEAKKFTLHQFEIPSPNWIIGNLICQYFA